MPYGSSDKKKIMGKYGYTEHEAEIFIKAFNAALDKYGNEERAFKVAHSAVNKYQAKRKKGEKVEKSHAVLRVVGDFDKDYVGEGVLEQSSEEEEAFAEGFVAALRTEEEIEEDKIHEHTEGENKDVLEAFLQAVLGEQSATLQMPNGAIWFQKTVLQNEDFSVVALHPSDEVIEEPLYLVIASNPFGEAAAKHLLRNQRAIFLSETVPGRWKLE